MSNVIGSVFEIYEIDDASFTELCADPDEAKPEREALTFNRRTDCLSNARAECLGATTGALIAIGLEAAVGFSLYFIWQLCHIVR